MKNGSGNGAQRRPYTRKPINFTSVKALASRIEQIDARIAKAEKLRGERKRLSGKLMELLKQ